MRKGSTGSSTTCRRGNSELLVIAPNWLGDAVMLTPLLDALRRRCAGTRVSIACRGYVTAVFEGNPAVGILVRYAGNGVAARSAAVSGARPPGGWDACIVAPPSFSSALVSLASGARRRIGYTGAGRRALLTETLPARDYRRGHLSAAYLRLFGLFAGEAAGEVPLPFVAAPPAWVGEARRLCGEGPYGVLAPGASYGPAKAWPLPRYIELARRLSSERGLAVIVVGGPAERAAAESLAAGAGAFARSLAGALSLEELISVLRGAAVVVGNDSGPVHVAAALGTPTVAVFGPTSVEWTAPRGRAVRIVRADVDCAPCFRRECPLGTTECLERVSADEVFATARSLEEGEQP